MISICNQSYRLSIMNLGYLIPIVCFWHTISTEISKYKPPAITNNIISFIHCVSFILHYNYEYNLGYAIHISIGYYIYDLLYIISSIYKAYMNDDILMKVTAKTEFKRHSPFIVHHIAGMYLLHASLSGESQEHILYGYNILEKSNIILYISYHIHKEYSEYVRLNIFTEFCKLLSYSYYRVFQLFIYIHNNKTQFFEFHFITQTFILMVYCMGFAWSYLLVKKNMNHIQKIKYHVKR